MLTLNRLKKLYGYKYLIIKLAWSEFKLRYKSSALGFFWSLLEPLLMLLVLYVVFTNLMRMQIEYYQLFLLLGIVLWNFLARGTNMSIYGLIGKPSLVQKIYFPREILIISSCITAMMMTLLELVVFLAFIVAFRIPPAATMIYFPLIFFMEFILILGLSLGLSALNVYFRDMQFIWGVVLQIGFFATPILYPITIFPSNVQTIVMLNPMAGMISMARECTIYGVYPTPAILAYVAILSLVILLTGYIIFDRLEPRLAEAI